MLTRETIQKASTYLAHGQPRCNLRYFIWSPESVHEEKIRSKPSALLAITNPLTHRDALDWLFIAHWRLAEGRSSIP